MCLFAIFEPYTIPYDVTTWSQGCAVVAAKPRGRMESRAWRVLACHAVLCAAEQLANSQEKGLCVNDLLFVVGIYQSVWVC